MNFFCDEGEEGGVFDFWRGPVFFAFFFGFIDEEMDGSFGIRKGGVFDVGVFDGMKGKGDLRKGEPIGFLGEEGVEVFDEGRIGAVVGVEMVSIGNGFLGSEVGVDIGAAEGVDGLFGIAN